MNPKLKLAAYAVMVILCVWFGLGFYSNYKAVTQAAVSDNSAPPPDAPAPPATNTPPATNAEVVAATNGSATVTNGTAAADTNNPAATNAVPVAQSAAKTPAAAPVDNSGRRMKMMTYLAAFVGSIIGLGLLVASDVTQFMGSQAIEFLFNDSGAGERDPEYEKAEGEWAKGKFLDAIQMMRDYLKKHPREMYVAIRIAEIYEKDLKNNLAATLEYEEILKHRLPAERWGWSAIHLCNLYSKTGKSDKALELLKRIANDYPKTGAAKKARARLGIAEPEPEDAPEAADAEGGEESADGQGVIVMEERPPELEPRRESPMQQEEPSEPAPRPDPSKPSLPPGFRKK